MAPKKNLDKEIDRLYGLPLDEFTAERNALAKRLRSAGVRSGAETVRKLKKPDAVAWAINQAVRRDPQALRAMLSARARLQKTQARSVGGKGDTKALRQAISKERDSVQRLAGAAERIGSEGNARAPAYDVAETLQVAMADATLAAALEAGRLTKRQRGGTLGFEVSEHDADGESPRSADQAAAEKKRQAEVKKAEKAADGAQRKAERSERRLDKAREELARLEAAADAARGEADAAQERVTRLRSG